MRAPSREHYCFKCLNAALEGCPYFVDELPNVQLWVPYQHRAWVVRQESGCRCCSTLECATQLFLFFRTWVYGCTMYVLNGLMLGAHGLGSILD